MSEQTPKGAAPAAPAAPTAPDAPVDFGAEVPEELHPLLQKLLDNMKTIVLALGAVLLAAGAFAVIQHVKASNIAEARTELGRIAANDDAAARVADLEKLLVDAPSVLSAAVRLELALALSEAGRHEDAAKAWGEVASESGEAFNTVALLGQAAELSRAGEHGQAMDKLVGLKDSAPEGYAAHINRFLAAEAEEAGRFDVAIQAYQDLKAKGVPGAESYLDARIRELTKAAKAQPAS